MENRVKENISGWSIKSLGVEEMIVGLGRGHTNIFEYAFHAFQALKTSELMKDTQMKWQTWTDVDRRGQTWIEIEKEKTEN